MIRVDPVLRAAQAHLAMVLSVPVAIEDAPDDPECIVLEYAPSSRPGSLGEVASDLAARIRIRGIARGVGAGRRAQALSEAAADVLLDTRLSGQGWTTGGHRHVVDSGSDMAGDLANATVEIELFITASKPV